MDEISTLVNYLARLHERHLMRGLPKEETDEAGRMLALAIDLKCRLENRDAN